MRHESKIVEESAVPAKIKALYFAMAHKVGVQAGAGGARDTWVLQRMYYVPWTSLLWWVSKDMKWTLLFENAVSKTKMGTARGKAVAAHEVDNSLMTPAVGQ
jgi:hypothetical protein